MGNRGVVTGKGSKVGIYLHWNGGRDSVEAFLKYCEIQGYRGFNQDPAYAVARFAQTVANFFGSDGLSVGVESLDKLDMDNYDNGVYVVDGWNIVERQFNRRPEQRNYGLFEMMVAIDESQPEKTRLGCQEIKKRLKEAKAKAAAKAVRWRQEDM